MQSFILKEDHQVSCFPQVRLLREEVFLFTTKAGSGAGAEEGLVQERGKGRGEPTH